MLEMLSAVSDLIRVCVAIAMSFGFVAWMPVGECARAEIERQCACSMCAGAAACCVAPEVPAPSQQPAAPSSVNLSEVQPLALADRPAVEMPLPEVAILFPAEHSACRAVAAGHSFQSVRCMWMV